ncbi:4'-phosphopantetheinyl transferase superfamily protein [Labilibacter sediminis]|nr:4'-phosphopantetheinyl transferase superfamily protein [Labilibacter sediminis]
MPKVFRKDIGEQGIVAVWHITESLDELSSLVELREKEIEKVQSYRLESKKLEFWAVRCLVKHVLGIDPVIDYLESGRPVLTTSDYKLSISHTKGYVAISLSKGKYVGIDIEYPSARVQKVYTRFISDRESEFIPEDQSLEYYTVIWCLKETMYKMIDRKSIIFNHHFVCHPFKLTSQGVLEASYCDDDMQEKLHFDYIIEKDYYLVYHC